jgi:hypothetical protein
MANTKTFVNSPRLYYVCDTRSIVGNCLLFWRRGNSGYTCNLDDCEVYPEDVAMQMHKSRTTDMPYPKDIIDGLTSRYIDHQVLDHYLNTQKKDAPQNSAEAV